MKKRVGFFLFSLFSLNFALAQTISISGTVKTQDGDALHLAFVQDRITKSGAYTDSLGNFSLAANPDSKLRISCFGFKDTLISINNRTSFAIVLRPSVNITANKAADAPASDNINQRTLTDQVNLDNAVRNVTTQHLTPPPPPQPTVSEANVAKVKANLYAVPLGASVSDGHPMQQPNDVALSQGSIYPVFTHKEATEGSRYLFGDWVHGYVLNSKDSIIQSPVLFFNYDKIGGSLLLSKDKHSAVAVYNELIKTFTLVDQLNQQYTFTLVPEIDKTHFVQIIASGNSYKIYKTIKTKFVAADYSTNGIASTGNAFDSFQDEFTYYILNVKTNSLQKLPLKKKAIKEVFAQEPDKLNKFMGENSGSSIDDSYLASLGDYMNK